jgi:hypothetical protein
MVAIWRRCLCADYVIANGRVTDELENAWQEAIVALHRNLPRVTEEDQEKP